VIDRADAPSLPAPRFAADTAGRRGALSSRSSPYLKPSGEMFNRNHHCAAVTAFASYRLAPGSFPARILVFSLLPTGQPEGAVSFPCCFRRSARDSALLFFLGFFATGCPGSGFLRQPAGLGGVFFSVSTPVFLFLLFLLKNDGFRWVPASDPRAHMTHTLPSVEPSG
jgi:hypothetical protein